MGVGYYIGIGLRLLCYCDLVPTRAWHRSISALMLGCVSGWSPTTRPRYEENTARRLTELCSTEVAATSVDTWPVCRDHVLDTGQCVVTM